MNTGDSDELASFPAPAALSRFAVAWVRREESVDGRVVRMLAELRPSIQIQLRDPLWARGAQESENWVRTPRIALWAPSYHWRYGYLARHVRAYAIGLTPLGFAKIVGGPGGRYAGQILDFADFAPALAAQIAPLDDESFDNWRARIEHPLTEFFSGAPAGPDFRAALDVLATQEGGAVALAARATGLSERQFRRVFQAAFGVTPKRYQRALRVDRLIRRLHPVPWEDDTYGDRPAPFADQPHAIREFREMTGMTPTAYVAAKRAGDLTLRSIAVDDVAPPAV